jgi:dihydrofolate reductase
MIPVHVIVAIDDQSGIGKGGELPWHLSGDLKNFRNITCSTRSPKKKNIVLMGRKTWDSIPKQFQPLHDRINVVLTRNRSLRVPDGVLKAESFDQVLQMVRSEQLKNIIETVYVIGGQQVYEETLKYQECNKLYVTQVHGSFHCDAFFPNFSENFKKVKSSPSHNEGSVIYHFEEYERIIT